MKPRRRHTLIRLLGWTIRAFASVLAVLTLLVVGYLLFFDYSERLRLTLENELTDLTGAPARVGSINLNVPRYGFELRDISIRVPGRERPVLELERVQGKLLLSQILNLRLQWDELVVDGLSVDLVEDPQLGLSLPGGSTPSTPLAGFTLAADRITVREAVLRVANERVPWKLEAAKLDLELERLGRDRYSGRVAYEEGRLAIKNRDDIEASLVAEFEIVPHEVFFHDTRVNSDVGWLEMRGKLGFAAGVHGRFDVSGEGDLARGAESVLGLDRGAARVEGAASFRGTLTLEPENKILQGTLLLPRGRLAGFPLVDWRAEVFWDRTLLQVGYATGRVSDGGAKLQLHQPLPVGEHPAAIELDLEGASLARLVAGARERPSPVDSVVSGRASFAISAESSDLPRSVRGEFELRGVAPDAASPTPISFNARGSLNGGDVQIEEASFRTTYLEGTLTGSYPASGSARLVVDVETRDLAATDRLQRELRALLRSEAEPEPGLWGVAGRGGARGELSARLPHLQFEGELSAEALQLESLRLGNLRARSLWARDRLSFEDLVANLDDGALAGRGTLSLSGPLTERELDVDVTLSRWPASERTFGLSLPFVLAGRLSGNVAVRRASGHLAGSAALALDDAVLAGRALGRGEARLRFDGSEILVDPISIDHGGASSAGRLAIDTRVGELSGTMATTGFSLQGLGPDWASLEGVVGGTIDFSGSLDAPVATLSGRGRAVRVRGVELGESFVTARLHDGALDLNLSVERHTSELALEASIRLEGDYPARGRLQWREIDWAPWLGLVLPGSSEPRALSWGEARFEAPLRGPEPLADANVEATLSELVLEGESYRIASVAPVAFRIRNARFELPRLVLAEGESRLALGGSLDLAGDALDFEAEGVIRLGVLESIYPTVATTGETSLSARVTGSWAQPSITGHADVDGGSIRLQGFRQALGGLRGRLVFDNRTLRIPELEGVFGSGPVTLSGTIALDRLRPSSVDLMIRGSGVRLRYPEGLVATIEGELSLLGSPGERMLSGAVVLGDAVWSREYDLVSGILSDREGRTLFEDLAGNELLGDLRLDVVVRAPQSLKVRNSLAVIDASAELELRGTLGEPVLLGRSEADHGDIFFLGQRYEITSGKVDFVDPSKVEPFVDLTAETRVRSYRVELRLTGTPDRFHPELSSDPPLRTVDILRLLAGANERDILLGNEEEELAGVGVASLLTERLTQEVGRRAERLFGLDRFSIDPFLVGQFANPTARVSLGKQISQRLSVNYSTNLNATTEAIILIEYTPEGPMSWILSRDEEGDVGIDVKFRKSF